jgi:hypothetical protein
MLIVEQFTKSFKNNGKFSSYDLELPVFNIGVKSTHNPPHMSVRSGYVNLYVTMPIDTNT